MGEKNVSFGDERLLMCLHLYRMTDYIIIVNIIIIMHHLQWFWVSHCLSGAFELDRKTVLWFSGNDRLEQCIIITLEVSRAGDF